MPSAATDRRALVLVAASVVAAGAAVLIVLLFLAARFGGLGVLPAFAALGLYAAIGAVVVTRIGRHHPHARFGAANTVTLIRALFTCLIGGFAAAVMLARTPPEPSVAWSFFGLAALATILDGIDGPLARHSGLVSPFGSRFDMEIDALLILLLSIAALGLGKAGAWVLIGGALRYAFVVAGRLRPVLATPLPPSQRRKLVCALQSGVLVILLIPIVVPPVSSALAFAALVLLVYSFATDVAWALRTSATQRPYRQS